MRTLGSRNGGMVSGHDSTLEKGVVGGWLSVLGGTGGSAADFDQAMLRDD